MKRFLITTVAAVLAASPAVAHAQNPEDAEAPAGFQRAMERYMRLDATSRDLAAAIEQLISGWRGQVDESEFRAALTRLQPEQLVELQGATSPEEVNAIIFGAKQSGSSPKVFGSPSADTVYTPMTPCRIVDTRLGGGILVAGTVRGFDTNGPDLSAQGGSATGCPPLTTLPDVAAIAATVTAVGSAGPGDLRIFATGGSAPTASTINYANTSSLGLNLANTTIIPLLQDVVNVNEFSVQTDVSNTHLVVDVVGFFFNPERTPLDNIVVSTTTTCANGADCVFFSPTCPATYRMTGGGYQLSAFASELFLARSSPDNVSGDTQATRWRCSIRNLSGAPNDVSCWNVCSRTPGR